MGTRGSRLLALLVLVAACVGCDRATKAAAAEHLPGAAPRTYLGGAVRLEYAENRGAFLGLGKALPEDARFWLLTVATAALVLGVAWISVARDDQGRLHFTALGLMVGGGIGNLVDRVTEGFVVDFVVVEALGLRTGVFNLADVAITSGALLLLVLWAFWAFERRGGPGPSG